MAIISTSLIGTNVRISFTAPNNNGKPIDKYQILILQSDGLTYTEDTTDCDGSNAVIISNLYCDIPMQTLRNAPYLLT